MTESNWTITSLTLPQIRHVYRTMLRFDFPADERKPLRMIEQAFKREQYICFGALAGDEVLAYAFFVRDETDEGILYLFDYFAVREDLRGTGIGSAFLSRIKPCGLKDAACVLLEVDHPDHAPDEEERAVRERRLRFYLRNGLIKTGVSARVFGVDFLLLEVPQTGTHTPPEVKENYERIYRSFLPEKVYRKMVKTVITGD